MIIIVAGIAAIACGALVVNAATTAQQSAKKKSKAKASFQIKAKVAGQLRPGVKVPVKISLANNRPKAMWITRLTMVVGIDKTHVAAGCNLPRDYRIEQIPKKFFPYKLAKKPKAKRTKKKKKPKVPWKPLKAKNRKGMPTISMVDVPTVNQDACKGATLTIAFKSKATMKKPKKAKR